LGGARDAEGAVGARIEDRAQPTPIPIVPPHRGGHKIKVGGTLKNGRDKTVKVGHEIKDVSYRNNSYA